MAVPTFLTERMIFVHVPKTGGSWVTQAVTSAGVQAFSPDQHGDQEYSVHGHADLGDVARGPGVGDRFTVAFVRHPLDWWRSYWGHRMRSGWDEGNGIDQRAASDDFNEFILGVLENRAGSFDDVVGRFVGLPNPRVDFVGRFEHLVEDTCTALRLGGERFSAASIRSHPRENANDYGRFPALYRPDVAERLAEFERGTIERFYADEPVPPALLVGGAIDGPDDERERLELRLQSLERALSLARHAETHLENALAQTTAERDRVARDLWMLQSSRLVRRTRTLRVAYYRARSLRTDGASCDAAQLPATGAAPGELAVGGFRESGGARRKAIESRGQGA